MKSIIRQDNVPTADMGRSIMAEPTIDILLATHNGEKYIREQIASIQRQTYKSWRLLISDDSSSDGTFALLNEVASFESRVILLSNESDNHGACGNFFYLLSQSRSPYFVFCDQDDVWPTDRLERMLRALRSSSEYNDDVPMLLISDMAVVDAQLSVISESFFSYSNLKPGVYGKYPHTLSMNVAAGCSMLGNASLRETMLVKGYNQKIIMHDWWACLVASAMGHIVLSEEVSTYYRQHESNNLGVKQFSVMSGRNIRAYFSNRKAEYIDTFEQAGFFCSAYEHVLTKCDYIRALNYIDSGLSSNPACRLALLAKSGAWRSGARKWSQLLCFLTGF